MKISPARTAAFDILMRIETDKAFSSVLLPKFEENLSLKDRGLCHELTLGVLRRKLYLDRIILQFTSGKRLDSAVQISLRIGLYQLLFLDKVPAYSAINDSVNLIQRAKKTSAKSLVNAVLRRVSREAITLDHSDETDRVSVETSHPRWLIEKWQQQFGPERAKGLAESNNRPPRITFRFTAKANCADSASTISSIRWRSDPSSDIDNCYCVESADAEILKAAAEGLIYFQDQGSQIIGNAVELEPGDRFLDVCAAPGSKTTQIAAEIGKNDIFVVAGDRYRPRVEFLRKNCVNQGVEFVSLAQYDAEAALPFADSSFDAVLVDAPCSGTGTIRHNPEIRYFLEPEDFKQLSDKQLRIAVNASKLVKPGGTLIYSTCSLEVEENEEVIKKFLSSCGEFRLVEANVPRRFMSESGTARIFPDRDDMDGFFIAALKRLN